MSIVKGALWISSMSTNAKHIAIAGAGIGGLVVGIAAARAGLQCDIYEQADNLGEVGAGITISPNSDRVLQYLGLGPALAKVAFVPERQWTQHWQTGEVLVDKERGPEVVRQYGAGYYHVHRADLHRILVDAFKAVGAGKIHLGERLVACDANAHAEFASGKTITPDVLIGADGVKSTVRDQLFDESAPQFTGQVAWRGVVPVDDLSEHSKVRQPGIHIGPERLVARYPIRCGELINYAAFVQLDGWFEEGWAIKSSVAELAGHMAGCDPDLMELIEVTPPDEIFKWALFARDPLQTWVQGRVTLLGDAAHAMLPFMGQGAGTAIEDAMVLARLLSTRPIAQALTAYEAMRLDRTSMVQLNSRLMGMLFQGKEPESFGHGPIRNEEALGLFDYDAVNVALPATS